MRRTWLMGLIGIIWLGATPWAACEPPLAEKYLHDGKLAEGEKALLEELQRNPKDDQVRFGLGALQVVRAVEHLAQSLHRYGLRSDRGERLGLPFLRLPVPTNPKPEALTYADVRMVLQDLINDLAKAEATLAEVRDNDVKLPLRVGLVRLDLTGDGQADDRFSTIVVRYMGGARNVRQEADWLVVFDRGDVAWLRGYCHLLMAVAEVGLAHDGRELFDHTAHLFFAKPQTPYKFLVSDDERRPLSTDEFDIVDLIAFIHLVRLPVAEPERMKSALAHLERMLELSRESWTFILAETDDDQEWIPNPKQTGVLGVPVRQDMVDSWLEFIAEAEALLTGKRLAPFWRRGETRGVNLRRVFREPGTLDLVLWVQGTAAVPYLEDGTLTKPEVWQRLLRVFRGEFIGFALWFN